MTVTISELREAIMKVKGIAIIRGTFKLSLEELQVIVNTLSEIKRKKREKEKEKSQY